MAGIVANQREAQKKILSGVNQLANTIKGTLGPRGRNVMLYQKANLRGAEYSDRAQAGAPVLVTNDGATIAKAIVLEDRLENMGVQLLKGVTDKADAAVGDGTTTAAVLAQAMANDTFRNLTAGADPRALQRGIAAAADRVVQALREMARPAASLELACEVAAASCQDKELGKMIGRALHAVGLEGVIQVEESPRGETTLEILEGILFERGFLSPYMASDALQTEIELKKPLILLSDQVFTDPQDLIPALILAAEQDRPCLIICDGVRGEALGLILKNKAEGDMDIVCVQAPLYGEGRTWRMEDLAVQTGGTYLTKEMGADIRRITMEQFGTADFVKVTRDRTIIIGGGGDAQAIRNRVDELRYLATHTDYAFNQKRYQERLAKFVSGVAIIGVGGATQVEIQERKLRVEDAVHAAQAAWEEGVVPGGGVAFLDAAASSKAYVNALEGDMQTGARILLAALEAPIRQILHNAGEREDAILGLIAQQGPGKGFDVETGRITDMLLCGVADPLKVTRTALESAVSLVSVLLTSQAAVVER